MTIGIEDRQGTTPDVDQARRARPVLWWAGLGTLFLCVGAYSMIAWASSGNFTPTRTGVTPVPGFMRWSAYIQEWGGIALAVVVAWLVLIRPWRRLGHISVDGSIFLALITMWWTDPLANYFGPVFSYNSVMVNWGSWTSNIPGWVSANGSKMPEPPLYAGLFYTYAMFGAVALLCYLMRRAKSRWPTMGTPGLILVCFASAFLLDFAGEVAYVRLGSYTYMGVYKPLTLFYGHFYQFPMLVPMFTGLALTGIASVRYFKNDRGETVVERGIDRVGASSKKKYLLRVLALVGVFNALSFVAIGQYWWTAAHQAPWPKDIQTRSYFMNGICGPGTDTACPGGVYPIPTRGTIHVSPHNQLVVPAGSTTTTIP